MVKNTIVFTTPEGKDVLVTFVKGPIGITFNNKLPLKAEVVQGHARELGVQPGWLFKSIQGAPCAGKDFDSLQAELVSLSQDLEAATNQEGVDFQMLNVVPGGPSGQKPIAIKDKKGAAPKGNAPEGNAPEGNAPETAPGQQNMEAEIQKLMKSMEGDINDLDLGDDRPISCFDECCPKRQQQLAPAPAPAKAADQGMWAAPASEPTVAKAAVK